MKKKYFLWSGVSALVITVFAAVFWPPLSVLVSDTSVQGQKYYSLDVSSVEEWFAGYTIFIFRSGHFRIFGDGDIAWQTCRKLHKNIDGIIRNYAGINEVNNGPYEFITEIESYGYKAYIKTPTTLIFIIGYADMGGDLPDENERKICMAQ